MATYKVIQDIEAEDKLVGPLSFRQFVYGLIAIFCLYLCVVCVTHHVAFLAILFLPPALFTGFLAFPFRGDQPTEVWALAKLRFMIKPRRRIWDQSGVKELVTVTAPKKVEVARTNGLDQDQVKSRLHALADTIDSRGWAIKNVNLNLYSQPGQLTDEGSDRLISLASIPQEVPDYDVQAADDILDEQSNPLAQQMDKMINASTSAHRQHIMEEMQEARAEGAAPAQTPAPQGPPADYWFLQQSAAQAAGQPGAMPAQIVAPYSKEVNGAPAPAPQPTAEEQSLAASLKASSSAQHVSYPHLHTIQPLSAQAAQTPANVTLADDAAAAPSNTPAPAPTPAATPAPAAAAPSAAPVTPAPDPAILTLANNNDFNVATLAREAHKAKNPDEPPQDEVVISLH